ncbi:MAG: YihA family ribosome biogenesis GTP-binding protein [Candidatus Pacebacteria bacterium]|nr:YihA family ribosome biogenesis GTP-binding protein [Candidatus Paceibacterota bacterium]
MSVDITSAEFVKGIIGDDYMQGDGRSQIAFLGRSNVGKSSVINSLVNKKQLVRSSSTPGKTREANFYLINNEFYFVDFPGYGYAKMSKKDRDKIAKRILWYVQYSPVRPCVVVLVVDAQVGLTDKDEEMIRILKNYGHNIIVVANKSDKLKQQEVLKKFSEMREKLNSINAFMYSAKTKKGRHVVVERLLSFV